MNRLVTFAALLVGVWFLWRRYRNIFRHFWGNPPPPAAPRKTVANQPVTLERDPATGVYRAKER